MIMLNRILEIMVLTELFFGCILITFYVGIFWFDMAYN